MPEGQQIPLEDDRSSPPNLRRCQNPWKRNAQHSHPSYRQWMGILNRVTQTTLAVFLEQSCELLSSEPENLPQFFELLIYKAQDEPLFVSVYASLCRNIDARIGIRNDLIKACEDHFTESYQMLMEYNQIIDIPNQGSINDVPEPLLEMIQVLQLEAPVPSITDYEELRTRQRCIGHLRFISELLKQGVMPSNHVAAIVETILPHSDERSLECLCRLLSFAGQKLNQTHENVIESGCEHIETCLDGGVLSQRLRWILQDTLALRANGWRPIRPVVEPQIMSRAARDVRG